MTVDLASVKFLPVTDGVLEASDRAFEAAGVLAPSPLSMGLAVAAALEEIVVRVAIDADGRLLFTDRSEVRQLLDDEAYQALMARAMQAFAAFARGEFRDVLSRLGRRRHRRSP